MFAVVEEAILNLKLPLAAFTTLIVNDAVSEEE
jgi:hypothetical protein